MPRLSETAHLSILLGSGSSLPAIPQMKTTFEDFKKSKPTGMRHLLNLYSADKSHDSTNIEEFLSWLGNRLNGLAQKEIKEEKTIRDSLETSLVDSISGGFTRDYEAMERQSVDDIPQNGDLMDNPGTTEIVYEAFFRRIARLRENTRVSDDAINIFTTNYDLFVENSLDRLNYAYTDGFRQKLRPEFNITEYSRRPVDVARRFRDHWSPVTPFFKVYKLHGSLNWRRQGETIIRTSDWASKDAIVIAPTSSKYADSQGAPYSDLFRELSIELLRPNTTLIINGFGFGDDHINELLRQAVGRDDFAMIAFVDETESKVKDFMQKVSGNPKATFITNGKDNDSAHHFNTLADLIAYEDPFENHSEEDTNAE
ncbi:hypothetical protein IV55_GL001754 [Furfurilactobacillus siliginis]|uniref:Uncharacterized protein n=1 Tax=Furfurilactobacillus siliginis TaxID=348151 RepID=A0A0R2LBJ6_9LACO|nr:SIR2 family protein [Furfurilactobacillus siliginis]KRN96071.1 hypothetical protein IV55_GL001754 [Furfurilactobacillus siliginis]